MAGGVANHLLRCVSNQGADGLGDVVLERAQLRDGRETGLPLSIDKRHSHHDLAKLAEAIGAVAVVDGLNSKLSGRCRGLSVSAGINDLDAHLALAVGRELCEGVDHHLLVVVVGGLQTAGEVHLGDQRLAQVSHQRARRRIERVDVVRRQVESEEALARPQVQRSDDDQHQDHLKPGIEQQVRANAVHLSLLRSSPKTAMWRNRATIDP